MGVVQFSRDRSLTDRLLLQVRRAAQAMLPLLVLTDGWSAYPGSIRRAFREKVKQNRGVGRACLQIWPQLHIGTVIKRTEVKSVTTITIRSTGLRNPSNMVPRRALNVLLQTLQR